MQALNKTEVKKLINTIKLKSINQNIKINVFRCIKEFIFQRKNNIYKINDTLYLIYNNCDGWIYNIDSLKEIKPLPNNQNILFCGFCDSNDDIYHYWLKDKKYIKKYGINYKDYKNFDSLNWFITHDKKLYINHKYYNIMEV